MCTEGVKLIMYLILLEQDRKDESTFLLIIRLNKLWNKIF